LFVVGVAASVLEGMMGRAAREIGRGQPKIVGYRLDRKGHHEALYQYYLRRIIVLQRIEADVIVPISILKGNENTEDSFMESL
jgi:hypothetical protein